MYQSLRDLAQTTTELLMLTCCMQ